MADEGFRDDGTVICAVHGMRYDPALTQGCIRCPRPSQGPGKRSAAPPRSQAPRSAAPPSYNPPPSPPTRPSSLPRGSAPPVPFEPAYLGSNPYQGSTQGGPAITIMAGPKQRSSRRGVLGALGLLLVGGAGAAAWFLRPEGSTDWSTKLKPFRYGPSASLSGSMFVPTVAAEKACPLLLCLDHTQHAAKVCTRYAKHCEQHGFIAISSDAFGGVSTPNDSDSAELLVAYARANANVDATRPVVTGFGASGEAACRLAILHPDLFAGAILECTGMASWRDVGAVVRPDVGFFLFTRPEDPDHEAMVTMKDEMERKGLRIVYAEAPGRHEPMERDELDGAFTWLESLRA